MLHKEGLTSRQTSVAAAHRTQCSFPAPRFGQLIGPRFQGCAARSRRNRNALSSTRGGVSKASRHQIFSHINKSPLTMACGEATRVGPTPTVSITTGLSESRFTHLCVAGAPLVSCYGTCCFQDLVRASQCSRLSIAAASSANAETRNNHCVTLLGM